MYNGNCILGHESTGQIVAVGADVNDWNVGQRVAVNPNGNVCGVCEFCRSGRLNFCRQATLETALGLQTDGALAPLMAAFPSLLRAIIEAVLARDERRAVGQGQVVARLRGQDERAERLGPLGVAPAEVVEQGDPVGVGARRPRSCGSPRR